MCISQFVKRVALTRGKINEDVWYLDQGDGYMNLYTCQNSSSWTLRLVHFIACTSIVKKDTGNSIVNIKKLKAYDKTKQTKKLQWFHFTSQDQTM